MKLGRGWTQSPPDIAYHETSILIPLSTEEVRFTEQPVLTTFLFVSVWLVLVEVCIQSEYSALPCCVWTTSSFAICWRDPAPFSRKRYVVSAQYVGDAGQRVLLLRAICLCVHFGELIVAYLHLVCVWRVLFVVCFYARHHICGHLLVPGSMLSLSHTFPDRAPEHHGPPIRATPVWSWVVRA